MTKTEKTVDALTLEALQVPENKRNFMNDQVFKFVFGKKQRKAITIDFINAVLQDEFGSPVKDLEYEEQELSSEKHGGKESRLDVVCRLDSGALVDIEVQLLDQKNIAQRVLYYWAGEYRNGIHQGGGYRDLRPTIIICIVGFPCFEGDEAFSSWGICNLKTFSRLTKDLSLHFLEIPKFSASLKPRDQWTKIERWMCYFSNKWMNLVITVFHGLVPQFVPRKLFRILRNKLRLERCFIDEGSFRIDGEGCPSFFRWHRQTSRYTFQCGRGRGLFLV